MTTNLNVGIRCTAIPDGIVSDGKVRLSLVLTPDVGPNAAGDMVDLSEWPSQIAKRLQPGKLGDKPKLRIYLGGGADPVTKQPFTKAPLIPTVLKQDAAVANSAQADKIWQEIFPPSAFASLREALGDTVVSKATKVVPGAQGVLGALHDKAPVIGGYRIPVESLNWVQTRYLEESLNAFHDDSQFLRMFALIVTQEQRGKGRGIDPATLQSIYQMDAQSILGEQAVGWIKSIAASFTDRPFRQRVLGSLQDGLLRQLLAVGLGRPAGDAFGLLQRLAPRPPDRDIPSLLDKDRQNAIEDVLRGVLDVPVEKASSPKGDNPDPGFVQPAGAGQTMMRFLFQESARQHLKGAAVSTAVAVQLDAMKVQAGKNFEAFHQHWRNTPIGKKLDEEAIKKLQDDAARRKFFGIRALPALAKFVRLIVDVELKLSDLKDCDWVAAMFVSDPGDVGKYGTPGHTPDVTAFSPKDLKAYFRPAGYTDHRLNSNTSDLKTAPPIKGGVVNLRTSVTGGADPRFMISILDLTAALSSLRLKAEQDSGAQRNGTLLDTVSTRTTERQSRGLQLIDTQASDDIIAHLARFRYTISDNPPTPGSLDRPFFAEDLVVGYRPYIQRKQGLAAMGDTWRSLVARKVDIAEIAPYVHNSAYQDLRTRDHGYIRQAHKMQGADSPSTPPSTPAPNPAPSSPPPSAAPTTDGQMFAWMGASLGLSTDLDSDVDSTYPNQTPGQDPSTDLSLNIAYGFSSDPHDLQPALRVGDSYVLGLAPVYPNCGGPSLTEATLAFNITGADAVTLGQHTQTGMKPFNFGPPRDIPVPGILVSEAEARHWRDTERRTEGDRGSAEHVERIVLRSAKDPKYQKDDVKRYLIPPRASFEVAEQSGLFDRVFVATPPGAFADYDQHPTYGGFAVDADQPPSDDKTPPRNQQSRCSILKPIAGHHQPAAPYYPDPLTRNLKVAFERDGATPASFPDDAPLHAFWKQGASPVTAQPIELLIKRWNDGREGGRVDFGDTSGKVVGTSGITRVVDRLAIAIAPAEEVNLRFWCVPDRPNLLRAHRALREHVRSASSAIARQDPSGRGLDPGQPPLKQCIDLLAQGASLSEVVSQFRDLSKAQSDFLSTVDATFDTVLAALTLQTPDNGLNTWLTLEVVHAVDKPLAVPAIPRRPWDADRLAIHPVRVRRDTTWDKYVPFMPSDPLDKVLDLASQENGSTTYFVGQLDFNRPSTGEVRIEASWPVTDPASAIQKIKYPPGAHAGNAREKFRFKRLEKDRLLFVVKPARDRGLNPAGKLDLTFDETGALRGLNFPFDDTAAQEISLRIVATSRFAGDFAAVPPPPGPPDQYALGRFEVESRPPLGSKRLDSAAPETYLSYKVIVPASTAPTSATVSRLEWVMPETLTEFQPGHRVCVEKNFYPRLYLGQDWCRFDELLAVICAPENLVSDRAYSPDFKEPEVLAPVPLSATETLNAPDQRGIKAWDFGSGASGKHNYSSIAESVTRWGADPTTRSGTLTGTITRERFTGFVASKPNVALSATNANLVSVLLYKPIFDHDSGEFYVDIGIDPGAAHSPIVQLVVARYQPHVIDPKFHLSAVTRVRPFQIAPKRKVEVLIRENRHITAIVQGVGYTDRNPEIPASVGAGTTAVSAEGAAAVVPEYRYPLQNVRVVSLNGHDATTGIQVHDEDGQRLSVRHRAPQFYHPEMIWISEFRLPLLRNKYRYGIQIEEVDLHYADEAYEGHAAESHVVERLSNFSLTVDLERGLYLPGGDESDETVVTQKPQPAKESKAAVRPSR